MYLQLGDIRFEALKGFDSLQDKREAIYAEHALIDGKPRLQRTGDALIEYSGAINFHAIFCSPEDEFNALNKYRNDGEVLPLVFGTGVYEGDFVITTLDRTFNQTDKDGNLVSITCNVTLKEFSSTSAAQSAEQKAKQGAFAINSNRPLPAGPPTPPPNAAMDAANANKQAQFSAKDVVKVFDDVDAKIRSVTEPINTTIAQAQMFLQIVPSITAKANRHLNMLSDALNLITTLIGAHPLINSHCPDLNAQNNASKAALLTFQSQVSALASLPTVNTTSDALYVLNIATNTINLSRNLGEEVKKVNSAAAGIAKLIATKVKI